jgi:hypothetical protein
MRRVRQKALSNIGKTVSDQSCVWYTGRTSRISFFLNHFFPEPPLPQTNQKPWRTCESPSKDATAELCLRRPAIWTVDHLALGRSVQCAASYSSTTYNACASTICNSSARATPNIHMSDFSGCCHKMAIRGPNNGCPTSRGIRWLRNYDTSHRKRTRSDRDHSNLSRTWDSG